jgi:hypothetical protein
MASDELTGWTKEEVLRKEYKHPDDHEFDFRRFYCLAEIPRQPPEYDGPPRFCGRYTIFKDEDERIRFNRCRFHNGSGHADWESGIEAADGAGEGNVRAMEHGMYAEDENLKENWSDADETIYNKVMGWAEDYGFEEGDPEYMQLESLAMSRVREMRSEKFLNEHGEVVEREQFNPETGEVQEWEEVHPLSDNLRLKKKTIITMMKELGLTPTSKSQIGESDAEASAAEAMAEVASSALDNDDHDYDPEQFGEE